MNSTELKKAKRRVRRAVLAAREALGEAERLARTPAIHDRFLALPEVVQATTVMAYWSFGTEVPTPPLLERLHARGVRVALPRIRETGELEAVGYEPGDAMRETSFGVLEPAAGPVLDPTTPDVVLTPGVAFDRSGRRIGYGGGYYDRFLPSASPTAPRIAVAFDLQLVADELPSGAFDLPVGILVTEARVLRVVPGTSAT
jgi:5-formyltetrahydrofolate cyclo-ligase